MVDMTVATKARRKVAWKADQWGLWVQRKVESMALKMAENQGNNREGGWDGTKLEIQNSVVCISNLGKESKHSYHLDST